MKLIVRLAPSKPHGPFKWKLLVCLLAVVALLMAQQPITVTNASIPVTGTFWQTTQPVSGTFWQATQPVSFAASGSASVATSVSHQISSTSTFNPVDASAGNLYGLYAFNPNATPCYIQVYNSAAPTIGTTGAILVFEVQAGLTVSIPPAAIAMANFSTAITFATTTTDSGATLCTTGLSTNVFYK